MVPIIAPVDHPNIGRSTLSNRLIKSRNVIVTGYTGLTRDRQYDRACWQGRTYIAIGTGGISGDEEGVDARMAGQLLQAIKEADAALPLIDPRVGMTAADQMIAEHPHEWNKRSFLIANKAGTIDPDLARAKFGPLGLGGMLPVVAVHGHGIDHVLREALGIFPKDNAEKEGEGEPVSEEVIEGEESTRIPGPSEKDRIKIAIIGRSNAGKSTLVNRMLGGEWVIVYNQVSTTRDSIYIPFERNEKKHTLIDIAGAWRRGRVFEMMKKFSVMKIPQTIQDANMVIFVMDIRERVVEHDLNLLGFVPETGRALVIALNKWDGMEAAKRNYVRTELEWRLLFVDFADVHFILALHGTGVGHLYKPVQESSRSAVTRWPTSRLISIFEDAAQVHQSLTVDDYRVKLRYAHLGGTNPPLIIIHSNQVDAVPRAYTCYLEKTCRRVLELVDMLIRIEYKGGENPYGGKKNSLTARQVNKRHRLMSHHKEAEKRKEGKRR